MRLVAKNKNCTIRNAEEEKKQRTHVTGVGASWKQYYNRQLWLAQNHPTLAAFSAVPMKSKFRSFRFKANEKAEEHCLEKFSSFLEVMEQDQYLNTERTIFDSGTMFFWWVRRRQFFCFKDAYRWNYIFSVERDAIKIEAEKPAMLPGEPLAWCDLYEAIGSRLKFKWTN